MQVGWNDDALAHVPAGLVQDQHELFARTRSRLLGKGGERAGEELHVDPRAQMPLGPPRGRMHVATEIAPAIARMDGDHWPLSPRRPHAAQDRFEPDAMLIAGPDL